MSLVLTDRVDGNKYKLDVSYGQLVWTTTTDTARSEPTVPDISDTSSKWRIFFSNGQLGWELSTDTPEAINLTDTGDGSLWKLRVQWGQLIISPANAWSDVGGVSQAVWTDLVATSTTWNDVVV